MSADKWQNGTQRKFTETIVFFLGRVACWFLGLEEFLLARMK